MSCIQATTTYKLSLAPVVRKHHQRAQTVHCASLSLTLHQKSTNWEKGFFMSLVASYDALALMRQFSENTAAVVAEAQEVVSLSTKKSALKGDIAADDNRMDK